MLARVVEHRLSRVREEEDTCFPLRPFLTVDPCAASKAGQPERLVDAIDHQHSGIFEARRMGWDRRSDGKAVTLRTGSVFIHNSVHSLN